jgi:hypothetical protein
MADDDTFLSRWARRKALAKRGELPPEPATPLPTSAPGSVRAGDAKAPAGATAPGASAATAAGASGISHSDASGRPTSPGAPTGSLLAGGPAVSPTAGPAGELQPGLAGHRASGAPGSRPGAGYASPQSESPTDARPAEPLPTMADVAGLTRTSDYSRFVAPGVDEGVKRAAMKALFSDPHFNVMDGLDVYIEDYGAPNPIPPSMLRRMAQAQALGLFDDEKEITEEASPDGAAPVAVRQSDMSTHAAGGEAPGAARPAEAEPHSSSDEDTDLRLQQDHAAGRRGPDEGPGPAGG